MINDVTTAQNIALYAFEKFGDTVLRAAFACCGKYAEAEDITQDTFLMLHARPIEFSNDEHLKAWLLRVAINKSKNLKRSIRMSRTQSIDDTSESIGAYTINMEKSELWQTVASLPKKYSSVIFLFYYEGYSTKEIADIIGSNVNTVASLLKRGRDKLKIELTKEDIIYETE